VPEEVLKLRLELEKVMRDQNIMGIISDNYAKEISRRKLPLQGISNFANHDNAPDSTRPGSQTGSRLIMGFRQAVNGQMSRMNRNALNPDHFFSAYVEAKGAVP